MLGMRRKNGVDVHELATYAGVPAQQLWSWLDAPVGDLEKRGLLHRVKDRIAPTEAGLMLADTLAVALTAELPETI